MTPLTPNAELLWALAAVLAWWVGVIVWACCS
jgi:hypothetical protein